MEQEFWIILCVVFVLASIMTYFSPRGVMPD